MPLSKVVEALVILATFITIVWGILAIINDYIIPHIAFLSAIPPYGEWAILGFLVLITIIFVLIFNRTKSRQSNDQKKKPTTSDSLLNNIDPQLWYIEIYYSDKRDSPDTKEPKRPYYVVNRKSNQAYWVSDLIYKHVQQHKFCYFTYDNETKLKAYLKSQGITINDRAPSDEELRLWFRTDGSLYVMSEMPQELLHKYKENKRKLQDFKLILVFTYGRKQIYPPNRRLLVKISTNEVFDAPQYDLALIENQLLNNENFSRFQFEPYKIFCWRNGWKYRRWRYPLENELT